jgi:hypothetical protein
VTAHDRRGRAAAGATVREGPALSLPVNGVDVLVPLSEVPPSVRETMPAFEVDPQLLRALRGAVESIDVRDAAWALELPIWPLGQKPFAVTPRFVLANPGVAPEHDRRLREADLGVPVVALRHRGRTVLLDGYHRLAKADMSGVTALPARLLRTAADVTAVIDWNRTSSAFDRAELDGLGGTS